MKKITFIIVILFISTNLLSGIEESKASENKSSLSAYREPNGVVNTSTMLPKKDSSSLINNSDLIKIFSIFSGVFVLSLQIYLQHKSSLNLQRKNYKQKTQIQLYNEIAKNISDATEKNITIQTKIRSVVSSLRMYLYSVERGNKDYEIYSRSSEIENCHYESLGAVVELMGKIEQYLIINPNFAIFITAFSSIHHDLMESFQPLSIMLMENLPIDVPKEKQQQLQVAVLRMNIKKENIDKIEYLSDIYLDNLLTASCYVFDLSREAQNLLLGEVFKNKVPARKPIVSKYKVINTEPNNIKSLEKYFNEETSWGKEKKKYETIAKNKNKTS